MTVEDLKIVFGLDKNVKWYESPMVWTVLVFAIVSFIKIVKEED